mgnify:CR=1 FL=1
MPLSFIFRMPSFWWLSIVLVLSTPSNVPAAGDLFERVSLQGLHSIQVVLEDFAPEVVKDGLDRDVLKIAIEEQLIQAGITIEEQAEHALYVHLRTTAPMAGTYSYALNYEFLQLVLLFRAPEVVTWGNTWSHSQIGTLHASEIGQVAAIIAQGITRFIDDYQASNSQDYQPAGSP